MTSLTDRYITTVVGQVPRAKRPDIERELRDLIAEGTDAAGPGLSIDEAERRALSELGDPLLLAARYRDSPTSLVSPMWSTALKRWLLLGSLIAVIVGLALGFIAEYTQSSDAMRALARGTTAAMTAALVVSAAVLVIAVVKDRRGDVPAHEWAPDRLNDRAAQRNRALVTIVILVAAGVLLSSLTVVSPVSDRDGAVLLLAPAASGIGVTVLLLLLLAQIVRQGLLAVGTIPLRPLAWMNVLIVSAGVGVVVSLASAGALVNPALISYLSLSPVDTFVFALNLAVVVIVLMIAVADIVVEFRRAREGR